MTTNVVGPNVKWDEILQSRLPVYGHRNWIVVADAAYPAQSQGAIETITADTDHLSVLDAVVAALSSSKHVRAAAYIDQELRCVREEDAPGVTAYRQRLAVALEKSGTRELPHEDMIAKLDHAAQMFRVLIIKTSMTIPYTSVFFELDCAYWSSEAEKRLRSLILTSTAP